MDALFAPLATALGASVDHIKVNEREPRLFRRFPHTHRLSLQLIACLLISYPLGSLYIRIPTDRPALKHLFNIAVTLFYLLPVLNLYRGLLELLISILGTYVLAATIKGHAMPWIVFVSVPFKPLIITLFFFLMGTRQRRLGSSHSQVRQTGLINLWSP
jgi:lysophospholipid acyltransferase